MVNFVNKTHHKQLAKAKTGSHVQDADGEIIHHRSANTRTVLVINVAKFDILQLYAKQLKTEM